MTPANFLKCLLDSFVSWHSENYVFNSLKAPQSVSLRGRLRISGAVSIWAPWDQDPMDALGPGPDHQGLSHHHSWKQAAPGLGTGHLPGDRASPQDCQPVKKHLALRSGKRRSLGSFSSPQIPSSQLSLKTHTNLQEVIGASLFPFSRSLFIFWWSHHLIEAPRS